MSLITTRSDVKQLAVNIENLAKQIQSEIDTNNNNFLDTANDLVRENSTFVFALGEVYALEQVGSSKKVRARTVNPNFHNVRDARGRFARKI
jgi:hypothetical protein